MKSVSKIKLWFNYTLLTLLCSMVVISCATTSNLVQVYDGPKQSSNAIVTLTLPYELEVTEIDGKTFKSPTLIEGNYKIELLPGEHEIAVFYSEAWGIEYNSTIVNSELFIFKVSMNAGQSFVFKHNAPEDLQQAEYTMIASDLKIWVQQPATGENFQAVNITGQSSFFKPSNRKATKPPSSGSSLLVSPSTSQDATKQLKFWWKMADDKQRKAFSEWLRNRSIDGKGIVN